MRANSCGHSSAQGTIRPRPRCRCFNPTRIRSKFHQYLLVGRGNSRKGRLAMNGCVWRAGSVAMAVVLYALQAGAVDTIRAVEFAQNASEAGRVTNEPSQAPAARVPAASPAQSPRPIKKAPGG